MVSKQEKVGRELARSVISGLVAELCGRNGLQFGRIAIKNTRSRLGSCSSKKNLNFNWQIVKFPKEYMEYVVKHEVAHLKHPNHSKDFWLFLETMDPLYKEHKAWIRNNAHKYLKFN